MGLNIKWDLTYKCNLNCNHCINGNLLNNIKDEIDYNDFINIVDKITTENVKSIHFLGGEPTILKEFASMMEYVNSKKIDFGFNTNGLKLKDDKIKEMIINCKYLKNIVISLEGPTAEINNSIRGKNVFNYVLKNIKDLITLKSTYDLNNLIISINTVVSNLNYKHIIDQIEFCLNLGIDELVLLQLIPDGSAKNKNYQISIDDEIWLIVQIAEIYEDIKEKIKIIPRFTRPLAVDFMKKKFNKEFPKSTHGCGAGTTFAYINNKGQLFPCDRYKNIAKQVDVSLLNRDFKEIWSEDEFNIPFEITESFDYLLQVSPCNSCEYFQDICYPCPTNLEIIKNRGEIQPCTKFMELIKEGGKT